MTVLRYNRAALRLLGPQIQPLMRDHSIVCVHTMDGFLASTDVMFKRDGFGGLESHYGIGGTWGSDVKPHLDGAVYQWQDRDHTADANYEGNSDVISIETADNAPANSSATARWTHAQGVALTALLVWECSMEAHAGCPSNFACRKGSVWNGIKVAIPPVLIPDTKPGRRGLGMHRQGVENSRGIGRVPGYLVSGGVRWSTSIGKECPGDARAAQFVAEIIPAVQAAIVAAHKPKVTTPPKETIDLANVTIKDIWDSPDSDLVAHTDPATGKPTDPKNPTWRPVSILAELSTLARQQDVEITALKTQLGALTTQVAAILKAVTPPVDVDPTA